MSIPVLRPARAHGVFTAVGIGAMALVACSSSSSSKPPTTSSSVDTPSTAAHANAADKVHLAFTGDITGNLTPEADAPITCGQTGPQSAAIRGAVGGHTGIVLLVAVTVGTTQFPSPANASASYLRDGLATKSHYSASPLQGTGTGTFTFRHDGSGTVDLVIPFDTGSPSPTKGTSVHIAGSWKC